MPQCREARPGKAQFAAGVKELNIIGTRNENLSTEKVQSAKAACAVAMTWRAGAASLYEI